MQRNRFRHTLLAAILACALPFTAQAEPGVPQPGGGMPPPYHGATPLAGPGHHPMLHGIKLSEEQQDKLFSIMHAAAPALHEQMKALKKAREELRALAQAPVFDEAAAHKQADAIARATAELALLHIRTDRQAHELLTPEQRRQLSEAPAKSQAPQRTARRGNSCRPAAPGLPAGDKRDAISSVPTEIDAKWFFS